MSDVNVVQITNTYKRSQPAPTPPENSDFLVHPLVHFPEPTKRSKKKPCWKGYVKKGLKKKGNRMVNNCVPIKNKKK